MAQKSVSATFDALVGTTLTAVTFIWDYVQLQFEAEQFTDAARLNAYTMPKVEVAHRCWTRADDGWRDSVCARIGGVVTSASCSDTGLEIRFQDGASVTVSLREDDNVGPEAFELSVPGHNLIVS